LKFSLSKKGAYIFFCGGGDMSEMTPQEARQKWCPQYRVMEAHGDNRAGRCLAEDCADWVWKEQGQQPPTEGHCGLTHPE
jgi:hypothetical protein